MVKQYKHYVVYILQTCLQKAHEWSVSKPTIFMPRFEVFIYCYFSCLKSLGFLRLRKMESMTQSTRAVPQFWDYHS